MTEEETISNLKAYLDGDTAIGNIIPLRSVLESAIKYLEPSLPSNLDEAAIDAAQLDMQDRQIMEAPNEERLRYSRIFRRGFKAGARWMAGQGFSFEDEVYYDGTTPFVKDADFDIIELKDSVKNGDKVIVQIRKK